MKNTPPSPFLAATLLLAPFSPGDEIPEGLEGYTHYLSLNPTDTSAAPIVGTVGSWSWEDSRLGDDVFWRHQADWIAFNLSAPANVRFEFRRHEEGNNSKFFPSFTLYEGFNNTAEGAHFGANTGDLQWEPDSNLLTYVMHHDNATMGEMNETMQLPAGHYTLLLGGNAVAEAQTVNVNYAGSVTASPIPESSTAMCSLLAGLAFLTRRQR